MFSDVGSLKLAIVRAFPLWKSANATNQSFFFPPESLFISTLLHSRHSINIAIISKLR